MNHRFGGLASRRSSFVLEPDYADIAKRLRLMSQPLFFIHVFQFDTDDPVHEPYN